MKQLIIPDKVQKEMLTDFMIMGETRGLIGGYCEDEFRFAMPMKEWRGCLVTMQWKN